MFVQDEFSELDSIDLADLVRKRKISSSELVELVISRIEDINPKLNFMTNSEFDRARERAKKVKTDTPFCGVPFLVKDMIDVKGLPRTDGSRLMLQNRPARNVVYIDAIEKAGLNVLGMTNVPEFATGIRTDNEVFGATRNPWNPEYSVFSSSGGSAAAVASGVVSMAHGTDGGGSNRLPASATGIFGMKPSRTRMQSGEADKGHDIAKTNHVLSRTVRESALLFSLTEDKNSSLSPVGFVEYASSMRLRIGIVSLSQVTEHEEDVLSAFTETSKILTGLGHELIEKPFPVDQETFTHAYLGFFSSRLTPLRKMIEASTGKRIGDSGLVTPLVATGAEVLGALSSTEIEAGINYLTSLEGVFAELFTDIDLLLTPVSPVVCPKLDEGSWNTSWSDEAAVDALRHLRYTAPTNFAGCPAISVPLHIGQRTGLPVGTHLIAPIGRERWLFEVAYELEEEVNWKNRLIG